MAYHQRFIDQVKKAPPCLGSKLGRWAVYHEITPTQIAQATGATRQSVYNWMKGGEVFVAYRPAVEKIINLMSRAQSGEDAWRLLCMEFNLKP